jgi:CMP-N,N'-diacetyllegionaminic acid synthase
MNIRPMLAVIPARGGSKGLPGKNIRPLMGLPLIAHSILFAKMCDVIDECIVSTECQEIERCALTYGGRVPFSRPAVLAQDNTPMVPVLQHALREMERIKNCTYGSVLLLDPTSPGRLPTDVTKALEMLEEDSNSVGVVAVSEPHFNPRYVCVEERDGYLELAFALQKQFVRRQDVPRVFRINAALYLWKRDYLVGAPNAPFATEAKHRMLIVPEARAVHIDSLEDFQIASAMAQAGIVKFPWLDTQFPIAGQI